MVRSVARDLPEQGKNNPAVNQAAGNGGQKMGQYSWFTVYQESTRYCNYSNERFGNELTFIRPTFWKNDKEKYEIWLGVMQEVEKNYMELIKLGARAEEARSILPNSLKTEIVVTMNLREWRHFFRIRTSVKTHPQIREVSIAILNCIPVIFDDILV